jgi:diguanylate cyclase (GGDEF)-like protein/PAS domain S-box-containing protein
VIEGRFMSASPVGQPSEEAKALFSAFEQAVDAVVITGIDNEIRHFNAAAERMWGYHRDEVVGRQVSFLVPLDVREHLDGVIAAKSAMDPQVAVKGRREFRISRKDGSEAWGAFSISRVDYAGKTLYINFIRDVTDDVRDREQNALMALVAEKTDRVVMVSKRDMTIVYVNDAFTELFGYTLAEAMGKHPRDLLTGEYTDNETLERFHAQIDAEGHGQEDILVYDKDGHEIWISSTVNAGRNKAGEVEHLVAVLDDITESKQIHSLQHHVLENLANDMPVMDVIGDLCHRVEAIAPDIVPSVLHVDADGRLHPLGGPSLPPAFAPIIDGIAIGPDVGSCGAAAFLGHAVLATDIATDPRWQLYSSLPLEAGLRACWSTPIKARDGRVIGAFAFYFRETRGPTRWHQTIVDACVHLCALAIERHEARSEIARLAYFDALTGLPNRAQLRQILTGLIDKSKPRDRIAVMFLDIDHFKDVNDTLGHSIGDELLVKVTQRLCRQIRPADTLSRQGGDEFVIVLPNCDVEGAALIASRLLETLLPPMQLGAKLVPVSASIGVSIYPDNAGDIDGLLKHADAAMYQAKQAGRSTYRFFSAEMNRVSEERLAFSTALRNAIVQDALRLHYQPQVRADGRLYGVEALARWSDPVLGEVPPSKFIPLAEEYGLIELIGTWSLREACRQVAAWRRNGVDVPSVSVNLSPINFQNGDLATLVGEVIAENGLSPDMLMLEVTEGVVMSEHSTAVETMEKIRKSGVQLSMDDFGTGYSSLSRLAHLPIRELKIDRSFMRGLESEASALAITRAIIRVGQSLDMIVVAEGVETDGQRRILTELGCDVIQGFVYSPALPVPDFELWFADHETSRAAIALSEVRRQAHPERTLGVVPSVRRIP